MLLLIFKIYLLGVMASVVAFYFGEKYFRKKDNFNVGLDVNDIYKIILISIPLSWIGVLIVMNDIIAED